MSLRLGTKIAEGQKLEAMGAFGYPGTERSLSDPIESGMASGEGASPLSQAPREAGSSRALAGC